MFKNFLTIAAFAAIADARKDRGGRGKGKKLKVGQDQNGDDVIDTAAAYCEGAFDDGETFLVGLVQAEGLDQDLVVAWGKDLAVPVADVNQLYDLSFTVGTDSLDTGLSLYSFDADKTSDRLSPGSRLSDLDGLVDLSADPLTLSAVLTRAADGATGECRMAVLEQGADEKFSPADDLFWYYKCSGCDSDSDDEEDNIAPEDGRRLKGKGRKDRGGRGKKYECLPENMPSLRD